MNRMVRAVALAATMVFVLAASGNALEDDQDGAKDVYSRNGFYMAVAMTYAAEQYEDELENEVNSELAALGYVVTGSSLDMDEIFGINARGGYRLHPNLAVEAQAEIILGKHADGAESVLSVATPAPAGDFSDVAFEPKVFTGLHLLHQFA